MTTIEEPFVKVDSTVNPNTSTSTDTSADESPPKFSIKGLTGIDGGKTNTRGRTKDTPPRKARNTYRGNQKSTPGASSTTMKPGVLAETLANTYGQIGMMVGLFDPQCGAVIVENAVTMGESLEALAKESPGVRKVLEGLVTTTVWGQVIAAHMPMVMAIASHHVPGIRDRVNPQTPSNPVTDVS